MRLPFSQGVTENAHCSCDRNSHRGILSFPITSFQGKLLFEQLLARRSEADSLEYFAWAASDGYFKDPRHYLFFTQTPNGQRAARQFLKRLKERTDNRDKAISIRAFRTQLKAIHAWGRQEPSDLSGVRQPVLVANGEDDVMVPSSNSVDLARRLPNAEVILYTDAGHGGIFQYHEAFVEKVREFLEP
jgi:pimeloyl-ACP methyl ester carboxylesterase